MQEEKFSPTFKKTGMTNNYLSQTRPIYSLSRQDDGELVVEPGEICFDSVQPGTLYVVTFSVRNTTKAAQRIRIQPPRSGYFALNYIPCGPVAPGLDVRAELECQIPVDSKETLFADKIIASMGTHQVEIPVVAYKPAANIKFKRNLDFGNIVLNQPTIGEILFENVAEIPGAIKLSYASDNSFIRAINPLKFELDSKDNPSKSKQSVKFQIEGRELGHRRELIKVSIAGSIEDLFIDVSAHFIEQKLTLLTTDNKGMLETVDFGNLFYGDKKSITALLVNPGPFPLNFNTVFEGEEDPATGSGDNPQTENDIAAFYTKALTVYPTDGMVKAFSQIEIQFSFSPVAYVPEKGFAKQHAEENKGPKALNRRVSIDCAESEQRIPVVMQGTTTSPLITVNPYILRFGECPVNDRRDILVTVTNKTKYPTPFEFPVLANFKFNPTKGILQSMENKAIIASFVPPQLGVFRSPIKVSLANGLGFVEVRALGESSDPGSRKILTGGVAKNVEDFQTKHKFVNPEEELTGRVEKRREKEQKLFQQQLAVSMSGKTKLTGTNYIALKQHPPVNVADAKASTTVGFMTDPLALASSSEKNHELGADGAPTIAAATADEDDDDDNPEGGPGGRAPQLGNMVNGDYREPNAVELIDNMSNASSKEREVLYGLADHSIAKSLAYDHPMLQKQEHNKLYNTFLQESHARRMAAREQATRKKLQGKGALDQEDPNGVNLGMERGLDEPDLKLPSAGEPLWVMGGGKDGDAGGGANRIPVDENRMIVKKYSSNPATQAELRDCTVELTQDDLKLVCASHKTLDFGRVSVGSLSAKNFAVTNDLKQSVMVKVDELELEMQQSKFLTQIVPQGAVAGFDMYFQSRQVGKFRKTFQWVINGHHTCKVVVLAEVVPIELEMSQQELVMEFPFDSLQPTLSSEIVLTNPGNAAAEFLWGSAGAFQCSPDAGTISPGKSTVVVITWSPLSGKRSEEELGLHITGGVDQTLKVRGVLKETKAEFAEKRILLGVMAVGTEKVVTAQLKNTCSHPLVFFLNPIDERLGIKATPEEAVVLAGETASITLSITPKAAMNYDNTVISAKIRGGKSVSFRLAGSSIIPQLTLFEEVFDFGTVTMSSEYRLPLTILNRTSILTTLILDLELYPDFTPYIRGTVDEDEELLASVVGSVNADQEDAMGNQVKLSKEVSSTVMVDSPREDGQDQRRRRARKQKSSNKNVWKIFILPSATISMELVFRPSAPRTHNFKLPLFLQGIPEDKSYNRSVMAQGIAPVLSVSNFVVDFGDRVVSRDPLSRMSYFLETTIKNTASRRAVSFEIRELPEVIKDFAGDAAGGSGDPYSQHSQRLDGTAPSGGDDGTGDGGDGSSNQIFFVAPLKGELAPGSSMPIRVTFQPQSSANYSKKLEIYVKDQIDPDRPYLNILCLGSGVFPRLTFSTQHIALPNVPLGITSRGCATIFNNGYNSLEMRHRVSPNIPVPLDISYPDGQSVGIMVDKIRVVIAAKSDHPVSWTGKIEFYDQDGERFFVSVSGCTDGCLLTNYPFVRDYGVEYGFIGLDDQPVKFLRKALIAELRQQESKRKEELRRQRSLERMRAVEEAEAKKNPRSPKGKRALNAAAAAAADDGTANTVNTADTKKTVKSSKSRVSIAATADHEGDVNNSNQPPVHEGIDMDRPLSKAFDDHEASFLLKWLNRNICRRPFDVESFPHCIVDTNGDNAIDCIELMCSKKIPNVHDAPTTGTGAGGGGVSAAAAASMMDNGSLSGKNSVTASAATAMESVSARNRQNSEKNNKIVAANRLVFKFQQILNFLINNGALLSHINPISLLGVDDHVLAQEHDLTRDKSIRFTPAMLTERRDTWEKNWLDECKAGWMELLMQAVKVFVLSRVHYKDYIKMPGVVLTNRNDLIPQATDTGAGTGGKKGSDDTKKKKKQPPYPRDLFPSNVFTHAEAVLLAWASYHLEHATKLPDEGASSSNSNANPDLSLLISFNKRVVDLDVDFRDLYGFCQLLHSHITEAAKTGEPMSGYSTMERKAEAVFPVFEEMSQLLRMDLGVTILELTSSTRSILLMILHLFLTLPNLVSRTKIEFVGQLGGPIQKQIELANPSRKSIEYDLELQGSQDFSVAVTTVSIPPESAINFMVTLNARFVHPVHSKLVCWSRREGGLAGSTMAFHLVSQITGRKPLDTIQRSVHLFEMESFHVPLKSPFGKDATFQISLHVQHKNLPLQELLHGPDKAKSHHHHHHGGQHGHAFHAVKKHTPGHDYHMMTPQEQKAQDEEDELDFVFRQPFWCNEETISLSKTNKKNLVVYMLPFLMGSYTCDIVLIEKDTGEFCKEIKVDVGLPKISEKMEFGTQTGKNTHMALRLASKNLSFEKAFTTLADSRIKNANKKIKARYLFQSRIASPVVNEETGHSNFLLEFLSSFFQYRKQVQFVSEYMQFGKHRKSSEVTLSSKENKSGGAGGKYKKMLKSLIEPMPAEEMSSDSLNTSHVAFTPNRAGQYQSLAVVYSRDNAYDVRVVEVQGVVTMPDAKMVIEFNGPARQKMTQDIPILNESERDWNLLAQIQGKGFSGPKTLVVPAGKSAIFEVAFFTVVPGSYDGVIHLRSADGSDSFEYKLHGVADDPLAEDDLHFKCNARKKKTFTIPVKQIEKPSPVKERRGSSKVSDSGKDAPVKSQKFSVESDLPYTAFSQFLEVGADGEDFKFTVNSPMAGELIGTITLTEVTTKASMWYTITVEVSSPTEEKAIDVQAAVRTAVAVDITLENPLDEPLVFDVSYRGDGLMGESFIELPPSNSAKGITGSSVYELIYSPLLAGDYIGQIQFTNEALGLLWYKLNLKALPGEPVVLDLVESMIGSTNFTTASLDNPLAEAVTLDVTIDDPEHFSIKPDNITLDAYAQSSFEVHFCPSTLNEQITSFIRLSNPQFGELQYSVSGIGLLPGIMPTVQVFAPLGEIGSQTFVFRNPFTHPLPLDVKLTHAQKDPSQSLAGDKSPRGGRRKSTSKLSTAVANAESAFGMLMRKTSDIVVASKANLHVPLSFTPMKMGQYDAVAEIRAVVGGRSLLWCYPIVGLAEAGVPFRLPPMKTACKTTMTKEFDIPLEGIKKEDLRSIEDLRVSDFSTILNVDEDVKAMVLRAFRAQPLEIVEVPADDDLSASTPQLSHFGQPKADFALRLRMLLEPLRTFFTTLDIEVLCRGRGKWRIKMDLHATEPEPDDLIRMVAKVGGTDKVVFRLNNRFLGYSNFQAYFTAKSSPHFSVGPSHGVLAPYGAEGTAFTITFAPEEYGIIEQAQLQIVTDETQWTYDVRGSYPDTTIDQANIKSKVDNKR